MSAQMITKRGKRVSMNRNKLKESGYILATKNEEKCTYYTLLLKGRVKAVIKREKGEEGSVFIMKENKPLIQCKRVKILIKEGHLRIECFDPDRQFDFF